MTDRAMRKLRGDMVNLLLLFGGLLLGLVVIEEIIPYYWRSRGITYQFGESIEHEPTLGWVNKPGYSRMAKPPDAIFSFRWTRRLVESALTRRTPKCLEPFTPPDYWESGREIIEVVIN